MEPKILPFANPNVQPERLILDTCMSYLLASNWFSDNNKINKLSVAWVSEHIHVIQM